MKKKLILAGAGGCMRELLWQIEELNRKRETWEVLGYVDVLAQNESLYVAGKEYPYLGEDAYLLEQKEEVNVAVCVGSSSLRKKIAETLMKNPRLCFPNLILSDVHICPDVHIGKGNIISMDCRISTNVSIGNFVFLNMGAGICHDGVVGDYSTLSPDVRLAGNVTIGAGSELGMGTKVIQGIQIGSGVRTGAGSVVVRNIPDGCTVVGVPAKEIDDGHKNNC